MAVERGTVDYVGVQRKLPLPFSPKIEAPIIETPLEPTPRDDVAQWHKRFSQPQSAHYLKYLSELPKEWEKQEATARVENPDYLARFQQRELSREEVERSLSKAPLSEIPQEVPIEVRNFRFWQKSLWRNEKFRKITQGKGFMGKDLDVNFDTRQINLNVKYTRNEHGELLVIVAQRTVTEAELSEIRKNKGDKNIKTGLVKHTIQLALSKDEGLTSTYLAIERFISKNGFNTPDLSFDSEGDFIHDERGKNFVGWLAVTLLQ